MRPNPYSVKSNQPIVATDLRFGKNSERAVGNNGDLNASNTKDLMKQISKFLEVSSSRGIVTEDEAVHRENSSKLKREMLLAAFSNSKANADLGEVLASELYVAANREGFMRRFLARQELNVGMIPMTRMRMKNQVAVVASAPVQVQIQIVRDNFFYPPEFYINARPFVEEREIQQSADDVLEEKFIEGLEAIMVGEDRTWYNQALATVGIANQLTTIVGGLTPEALAQLRNQVLAWDIPVTSCLIATDIWNDIIGNTNFAYVIDPVSKHDLLLTGQLGTIFGMTMYTDAYRFPQHKVLSQGDIFILGDVINTGQYTDRGGIASQPIDGAIEKLPGRGWWLTELVSIIIANPNAIARGIRQ